MHGSAYSTLIDSPSVVVTGLVDLAIAGQSQRQH